MEYLLDSHTLIWAMDCPEKLSTHASLLLQDSDNHLKIRAGSIWEIAIKVSKGRLPLSLPYREWIDLTIPTLQLDVLPITLERAERLAQLPFHHREPFDRLIAVQSLEERLPLLSCDLAFDSYRVVRIWD